MLNPQCFINLDQVMHDFKLAKKNCVKLSSLSFVIFHQNGDSNEKEQFEKLLLSLLKILQKNPHRDSLYSLKRT